MAELHLVRDLLDKPVVDRNGREMGRVDRIVLELREDAGPRVAAIEIGPSALASRVHPFLGRVVEAIEHVLGVDDGRPLRIPFTDILDINDQVKVDRAFTETSAAAVEQLLRRIVGRIPGASS